MRCVTAATTRSIVVALALTFASACAFAPAAAASQPDASASAAPSADPSPTATPRPLGLHMHTTIDATFIDRSTAGEGQLGPEAPGFAAGSPLAPNTPYDLFSSAPEVPGVTGLGEAVSTATYGFRRFDAGAAFGFASVNGSVTNAAYWGENLMPTLNPHLGAQALPYAVAFPTHAGQDDATVMRLSVLSGRLATADGNAVIRGGWFDLAQTDRFVFAPPALTSVNPALAYAPAETLSSGLAGTDVWQPDTSALPLHGLDATLRSGSAQFELTDAALPSLPGDAARIELGSVVFDRGGGTRFSAEVAHVTTSGGLYAATVPFGIASLFTPTPQGTLPTSLLSGQRETIAGLRGAFHLSTALHLDGVIEAGRSWYDADPVARPGTSSPGGYYRAGVIERRGRITASLDWLRMEPRYATVILPYGAPENQWSAAFAWPGQWLKSTYQLIDNSVLGVNRQGYRLRYSVDGGPLEVHAEYTDLRQIDPETTDTATQSGFVDGFYLPEQPDAATLGRQKRYALWIAWHPAAGDLTLDVVDDTLYRPFVATALADQVSYEVPQAVLTYARHLSKSVEAAVGYGRYAAKGAFSEPIDFAQRLFFAGVTARESAQTALLVSYRRSAFNGMTTFPASPRSPNYTGSALVVEQRLRL